MRVQYIVFYRLKEKYHTFSNCVLNVRQPEAKNQRPLKGQDNNYFKDLYMFSSATITGDRNTSVGIFMNVLNFNMNKLIFMTSLLYVSTGTMISEYFQRRELTNNINCQNI